MAGDAWAPLPRRAVVGDAGRVAAALLGCFVERGPVVLRIVEVEAYLGPEDSASHARFGRTGRTAPMWGPPGRAYVYLCYGLHWMLNVVSAPRGEAGAVLVRAAEPVAGAEVIAARRGHRPPGEWLCGPGRVGQALALDGTVSGTDLHGRGPLRLRVGTRPQRVVRGPRVGIEYAGSRDRRRPLRWMDAESPHVSRPRLRPRGPGR